MQLSRWSVDAMMILMLSQRQRTWCIQDMSELLEIHIDVIRDWLRIFSEMRCGVTYDQNVVTFLRAFTMCDCAFISKTLGLNASNFSAFLVIDSTQSYCLRHIQDKDLEFCYAEHQYLGKGRRSNRWSSSLASSILFSYKTTVSKYELTSVFSPCLALGIVQTLKSMFVDLELTVKWPNDILLSGHKLAGILLDVVVSDGDIVVVAGVGCNYDFEHREDLFSSSCVTNACIALNKTQLTMLFMQCCRRVRADLESGRVDDYLRHYDAHHVLHGKSITFDYKDRQLSGVVHGVNHDGSLRVQSRNGAVSLYAADCISTVRSMEDQHAMDQIV